MSISQSNEILYMFMVWSVKRDSTLNNYTVPTYELANV